MKKQFLALSLLSTGIFYAQEGRVGINTTSPKTTMDVSGKTDAAHLATDMTGLQAPRLSRAELTAKGNSLYGTDQRGALVYVTGLGGDNLGPRINIISPGYYYFDGTDWVKISSGSGSASIDANNGLNVNGTGANAGKVRLGGTLDQNTEIATAGFNTTFTGTGKLGIGSTSPTQELDVNGNVRFRAVPSGTEISGDKMMVLSSNGTAKLWPLPSPSTSLTISPVYSSASAVNALPASTIANYDVLLLDVPSTDPVPLINLPTSANGIAVGKVLYISQKSMQTITFTPKVREQSNYNLDGGSGGTYIYIGGTGDGSWIRVSGF